MPESLAPLVEPFPGERYAAAGRLGNRLAPPYDVITPEERTRYAARSAHNIVHLTLPAGDGDARYAQAAATLGDWRRANALVRDEEPSVYVVQQGFRTPDGRTHFRTGVIGGLSVEPYGAGRVKPHEKTHAGPKEDRLALTRATEAALEAIFVLAPDESGELLRRLHAVCRHDPTAVGAVDGSDVGLWRVGGEEAAGIAELAGSGSLYIADGHHRYETAIRYREERPEADRLPALIVPTRDPGLVVLPTHRVLRGGRITAETLLAIDEAAAEAHAIANPELTLPLLKELGEEGPACAVVLADGSRRAWLLPAPADEAGIAVVERLVISPLREAAGDGVATAYTPSDAEAVAALRDGAAAAVLVTATPVREVLAVADRGGAMPPKSTYFIPKVPAGLVLMDYRRGD